MRLVAISGSLRAASFNRQLVRAAAGLAPPGTVVEVWEGLAHLTPYSEDADAGAAPPQVAELRGVLAAADAILIATPEYNGSLPGQLKNALDWASRPFPDNALRGKPVAVIGASASPHGARWAQAELRKVLGVIGADVLERTVALGSAWAAFDPEGRLTDPTAQQELRQLLSELQARAQRLPEPARS